MMRHTPLEVFDLVFVQRFCFFHKIWCNIYLDFFEIKYIESVW